jgi:hypothetical protein
MDSSDKVISSDSYAQAKGQVCPVCGSRELDRAPASGSESGKVIVWVGCEICRHVWLENYQLIGYTDLELSVQPVDESPIVPNNGGRN